MDELASLCYAALLAAAAVAALVLAWRRADRHVRVPLAVYTAAYVLTSFLGGAAYGLWGAEVLEDLEYGLETSALRNPPGFVYWTVLFAPLIVPPLCALAFTPPARPGPEPPVGGGGRPAGRVGVLSFGLLFAGCTAWCLATLWRSGYLGSISFWQNFKGDYITLLGLRSDILGSLPGKFFGVVYTTLPALSQCALHQAVRTRDWLWGAVFAGTVAVVAFLSLAVIQKSLLLVYLVFLGVALAELRAVRLRSLVVNFLLVVGLLTVLQSYFLDDWEWSHSTQLLVFRVAVSLPFYLEVYPTLLPFAGPDLGLHILGLAESPRDNLDVFNHMYPTVHWIQGATAASAHVRGYAQGGLVVSLLTTLAVGLAVCLVARLRRQASGPIRFTLYVQSLVFLYYLTQVSLLDALLTSYGLLWSLWAVAGLWGMSLLADLQPRSRAAPGPPAITRPAAAQGR